MNIPPAGIIEMAVDDLKQQDVKALQSQQRELYSATGKDTAEFADGYALGLQTARVMLRQSTLLQMQNINPKDLL